jgi:hypothetical protein
MNTLPPLPLAALRRVQRLQKTTERALRDCRYPGTKTLDVRKAFEILRTSVVEELNARLDYFETLPGFEWAWMKEIITHATASVLACFPQGQFEKRDENNVLIGYEGDQQFQDELITTAWDYVVERRLKKAKPHQTFPSQNPEDWSPLHRFIEAGKEIKKLMDGPHQQIHEVTVRQIVAQQEGIKPEEVTWKQIQFEVSGLLPYYPAITLIPSAPQRGSEKSQSRKRVVADAKERGRRAKLLADYKAATGNPSHKRIYESSKAGLYKPQFYEWLNGVLPSDSETAKNFERFLSEKKRPIPRKPKS